MLLFLFQKCYWNINVCNSNVSFIKLKFLPGLTINYFYRVKILHFTYSFKVVKKKVISKYHEETFILIYFLKSTWKKKATKVLVTCLSNGQEMFLWNSLWNNQIWVLQIYLHKGEFCIFRSGQKHILSLTSLWPKIVDNWQYWYWISKWI